MGYNITIGNAEFQLYDDEFAPSLTVIAAPMAHDKAPNFDGDPSENTNIRCPSYSVWSRMCREAGIHSLFYGDSPCGTYYINDPDHHRDKPILQDHPGFAVINQMDADYVGAALESFRLKHTGLEAGFNITDEQANLARIEWLWFWMDWAVKNCERPIITNA
ncbi:MAG: hypothetical protein ABJC88_16855 [Parasphingorhabdus sp.]